MSNRDEGLHEKYYVHKIHDGVVDPEPVQDWVFVLKPSTDPGAVIALQAYIDWAYANGYVLLAEGLEAKLEDLGISGW